MSNTDTRNTTACISCGDPSLDPSYVETNCQSERCATRLAVGWGYSLERIHDIALEEDRIRKYKVVTIENLLQSLAETQLEREEWRREARQQVDAGDSRLANLWQNLYEAFSGDVEQDETWGLIMDAVPGVPDLRVRSFEVEIPLNTISLVIEAKDEDEAIELAIEQAEGDYTLTDVIYEPYITVSEA